MARPALSALLAVAALLAGTGASAGPADAPAVEAAAPVERVLVVSLPNVAWSDLDDPRLRHLGRLLASSAVANLATRAPTLRSSTGAGYATFGSGDKAVADGFESGLGFGVDEPFGDGTAGESFTRRTGRPAGAGIVHLGIAPLEDANATSLWEADLGVLGAALARAGHPRAVVGNADVDAGELTDPAPSARYRRDAVAALMGPAGRLPAGQVSDVLLVEDPSAPFGLRLDPRAVVRAFDAVWVDRAVVLVEASDLARADAYGSLQDSAAREASRAAALRSTDALVGELIERVDLRRDAVMVMSPAPPGDERGMTVVGLRAPGVEPGWLRSPTTQRDGFVQLMDLAPTVLDLLGLERPTSMRGRAVVPVASGEPYATRVEEMSDADAAARFRGEILEPVAYGLVGVEAAVVLLWLTVARARPSRWRRVVSLAATAPLGYVLAVYLARLLPLHDAGVGAYWAFLGAMTVALTLAFELGSRALRGGPVGPALLGTASIVVLLVLDVVTGSRLQLSSGFGFSPEVAGRFVGFGNVSYALLAASAIVAAALLVHRLGGRRGAAAGSALLFVVLVADAAPFWGADVGGVLTLVPAFAVTAVLLHERRIRWAWWLAVGAATVAGVTIAALVDWTRPPSQRTHLGRLVEQVRDEGLDAFTTVVIRKADMAIETLTTSQWRPMLVIGLVYLGILAWAPPRRLAVLRRAIPQLRAAAWGSAIVGVLGFALNDQGVIVPAAVLAILVPVLASLTLRVPLESEEPERALRPARAGAPTAPRLEGARG